MQADAQKGRITLGRAVIKMNHMDQEMAEYAVREAEGALETSFNERRIAQLMKAAFETKFKSNWHCVVGRDFGAWVTHETGRFLFFYIGQKGFLIWATPS